MPWLTEFSSDGVELQYRKRVGDSRAESRFRIKEGRKILYRGWAQDSFAEWKRITTARM